MAKDVESEDYAPREGELFIHSLQYEAAPGEPDVDRSWGPLIDDDQIWDVAHLLAHVPLAEILVESSGDLARGEHIPQHLDPLAVVQQLIGSSPVSGNEEAFRVIEWTDR